MSAIGYSYIYIYEYIGMNLFPTRGRLLFPVLILIKGVRGVWSQRRAIGRLLKGINREAPDKGLIGDE